MTQEAQLKEMIMKELSPAVDVAVKKWFERMRLIGEGAKLFGKAKNPILENPEMIKLTQKASKNLKRIKKPKK